MKPASELSKHGVVWVIVIAGVLFGIAASLSYKRGGIGEGGSCETLFPNQAVREGAGREGERGTVVSREDTAGPAVLTIATDKNEFLWGEAMVMTVSLANVGGKELVVVRPFPDLTLVLHAVDRQGNLLKDMFGIGDSANPYEGGEEHLAPGTTAQCEVDLLDHYVLTPTDLTIWAEYHAPAEVKGVWHGKLTSNQIKIRILPFLDIASPSVDWTLPGYHLAWLGRDRKTVYYEIMGEGGQVTPWRKIAAGRPVDEVRVTSKLRVPDYVGWGFVVWREGNEVFSVRIDRSGEGEAQFMTPEGIEMRGTHPQLLPRIFGDDEKGVSLFYSPDQSQPGLVFLKFDGNGEVLRQQTLPRIGPGARVTRDGDERFHLAWASRDGPQGPGIYYARLNGDGAVESEPRKLFPAGDAMVQLDLYAPSKRESIHLVWNERDGEVDAVRYATLGLDGQTQIEPRTLYEDGHAKSNLQVATPRNGELIYVLWRDAVTREIFYTELREAGEVTWIEPRAVDMECEASQYPLLFPEGNEEWPPQVCYVDPEIGFVRQELRFSRYELKPLPR